ncbi:hypothetical protein CFN78_16050 [Amycolatopsis antarctica]|uniref:Secreted protein n=1 Tax=Amycolatopsis antarctica TaxID=1854586 RepID=A0A263D0V0_9PSEU|nr:hypothetical protein [Amycolatopsis antarctica]OZM72060.1 hypothetical protein CFN78_16050 [Amycolatopsis antarctica]
MTRRALALLLPLFASVLVTATPAAATPAASPAEATLAWTEGPCPGTTGVTVVADLAAFPGGSVVRRCDTGTPATAFAALTDVELAPEHGTGEGETGPYEYLCRIDALPATADDSCAGFAPDAPYWAFWVPDTTTANWGYAEEGVDTYAPAAGVVLGFSFGAGTASDPNEMSLTLAQAKDPNWTPGS